MITFSKNCNRLPTIKYISSLGTIRSAGFSTGSKNRVGTFRKSSPPLGGGTTGWGRQKLGGDIGWGRQKKGGDIGWGRQKKGGDRKKGNWVEELQVSSRRHCTDH